MVTKPVHPELLDKLPTLKKAIENERIRTEELEKAKKENALLRQILKENNIEVD